MKKDYEAPKLAELGSLQELTQQQFNKVGKNTDIFSQLTNGQVIGSLTSP